MCGRYTVTTPGGELQRAFDVGEWPDEHRPRFNVAPGQKAPVVLDDRDRRAELMVWGLVPSWARDASIGNRLINARSETAAVKPSFRRALAHRRCLVVADGFYEWQAVAGGKQPLHVRRVDRQPFAFAGLWERWQRPGRAEPVHTFTILTTAPNALMAPIHHRMPVILPGATWDRWLDPRAELGDLLPMLGPADGVGWEAIPVSTLVNSPANDDPRCLEPVAVPGWPEP